MPIARSSKLAAPLLLERGLPAVLFTNPRVITGPCVPLDTLLSIAASRMGLAQLSSLVGNLEARSFGDLITGPISRLGAYQRENLRHELLARLATPEAQLYRLLDLFMKPRELAALHASGMRWPITRVVMCVAPR